MVPKALRTWFVIHFVIDVLFAVPLFLAPETILVFFNWGPVDPLATRLVAAALFGIGIQSYLGRNESVEVFRGMLNLKIIWSNMAALGIAWSLWSGAAPIAWLFLLTFVVFSSVWIFWRFSLAKKIEVAV